MIRKFDAYKLYLALQFLTGFAFSLIFVVTSLYEVSVANLTGAQLVLVGTALEVTVLAACAALALATCALAVALP